MAFLYHVATRSHSHTYTQTHVTALQTQLTPRFSSVAAFAENVRDALSHTHSSVCITLFEEATSTKDFIPSFLLNQEIKHATSHHLDILLCLCFVGLIKEGDSLLAVVLSFVLLVMNGAHTLLPRQPQV